MLFGDNLLDFTDPKEATAESREALKNIKTISVRNISFS